MQNLAQAHHTRCPRRVQHIHVQGEPDLEIGLLEQHLHQHAGIDHARFRLQNKPDILRRLIHHIAQNRNLLGLDQLSDLLDQLRLLNLIGDLGNDDAVLAVAEIFDLPLGAQPETAAPGLIGLENRLPGLDQQAARRKVRTGHQIDQLRIRGIREFDQMQQRVAQLMGIVRRDAGRHADRDTGRAVRQQVREGRGEDDRLAFLAVIGRPEVDRIFVDPLKQRLGDRRQPRFRVSHGRRVVAVDIAEIALAVDQRKAHREVLRQTHQCVIDGLVAMRVVFADHVADHAGAFLEARIRVELQLPHGKEQTAVHRLQPVAHIGQRARHDRAQRVGQITRAQRIAERRIADVFLG